ncbi:GNAT family N-acetyltransferase [Candidatus Thorarchaeota archaeon]|nr:MAG: GNAT family N-acetyltransferase [Candidatus Thorarchaeota archaeon]
MASRKAITDLEYISSLCWPGSEIQRYKGWIIQWNDGITWRANSVYPLGSVDGMELEQAIEYVISFYEQRDTLPAFKITEASEPEELDETLEDMGFEKRMITYVQTLSVNKLSCLDPEVPVDLLKVSDESIDTLFHEAGFDETIQEARRSIIKRIEGEKTIARVMIDGKIAGVGLGVIKDDWLALFSIRTLEEYRNRGVGWSVNCALGIWGEENSATKIFLQVEAKNTPALALYESMGFIPMYTYWYRILEKK